MLASGAQAAAAPAVAINITIVIALAVATAENATAPVKKGASNLYSNFLRGGGPPNTQCHIGGRLLVQKNLRGTATAVYCVGKASFQPGNQ